ncbi:hypothetical protein EON67_05635 [archaeon]|nr:MAG: hypothetical protein EON67_05635 [archaeon]
MPTRLTPAPSADLHEHGKVHAATMRLIERTQEWQDYDAHVTFELAMLKHRYHGTGPSEGAGSTPAMTTARRAQMQAHCKQKQMQIMETHAEAAAEEYLNSLTGEERARLAGMLCRLDFTPSEQAVQALASAPKVSDTELSEALWSLSSSLGVAENAGGGAPGSGSGSGKQRR